MNEDIHTMDVMKQRLFIDMDGTLAVFKPVDTLEVLYEKGYFENLEPIPFTIQAAKIIMQYHSDIEVYILSAYLSDSDFALMEKNNWLDKNLPEMPEERRIFSPCGEDKKMYIPDGIRPTDYLLDDYTKNLMQWQPPARGIKLLNGINHTRETWAHDRIWYKKDPTILAKNIVDVMKGKKQVYDQTQYKDKKHNLIPKI
jgi:5'(3')-deoxyribonucleotidase